MKLILTQVNVIKTYFNIIENNVEDLDIKTSINDNLMTVNVIFSKNNDNKLVCKWVLHTFSDDEGSFVDQCQNENESCEISSLCHLFTIQDIKNQKYRLDVEFTYNYKIIKASHIIDSNFYNL